MFALTVFSEIGILKLWHPWSVTIGNHMIKRAFFDFENRKYYFTKLGTSRFRI